MPYRFVQERDDYADFAAGPVLYSLPGRPAFPVRLASEIFQRCRALLQRMGATGPSAIYDPCCGSAYLLVTLGYLHRPAIRRLTASDVDPAVLPLAERNLSLLSESGVAARAEQLDALHRQFGKPSHAEALASSQRLAARLAAYRHLPPLPCEAFVADALRAPEILARVAPGSVDIVITDVPYGQRTAWHGADDAPAAPDPLWRLLEALRPALAPASVVAVTSDKRQRAAHEAFQRVEQLQLGKRRTLFFTPEPSS
jgi:23S rRNA (guanine2535-N1)-methyltransferase